MHTNSLNAWSLSCLAKKWSINGSCEQVFRNDYWGGCIVLMISYDDWLISTSKSDTIF